MAPHVPDLTHDSASLDRQSARGAETASKTAVGPGFPTAPVQRVWKKPQALSSQTVGLLQRGVGNHVVDQLLTPNASQPAPVQRTLGAGFFIQRTPLYDAVQVKAKGNQAITEAELENATREFLVDLVDEQGYKDSDGKPIGATQMQGVNFLWDADYGATPDLITMPSQAAAIQDIKDGVFQMALRHEMGHAIRSIGDAEGQDGIDTAKEVIDEYDWVDIKKKYPQANVDNWKEEMLADMKGVQLQYRQNHRFPTKAELAAFQGMLGSAVDNAHPPAAIRVEAMKEFIRRVKPSCCCYITTACVTSRGLADDCEELTLLRHFRDSYLLEQPNGEGLVDMYYYYSPKIVEEIDRNPQKAMIYAFIYQELRDCVEAIKREDMAYTYRKYCELVMHLKEQFIDYEQIPAYPI